MTDPSNKFRPIISVALGAPTVLAYAGKKTHENDHVSNYENVYEWDDEQHHGWNSVCHCA